MRDETAEIIASVRAVQDELERLGARRERIIVHRLSPDELEAELIAVSEQLNRRKRFLGAAV